MSQSKSDRNGQRLIVIGAGPGGYPAAFRASQLGFDVSLVDPRPDPGGVCLYEGCIPSKALLRLSKLVTATREASDWGLAFSRPRIDIDQMRQRLDRSVSQLTGGLGKLGKGRGVEYLQGKARFVDETRIAVEDEGGDSAEHSFDYAIVATGSSPVRLPIFDHRRSAVWDSTEALALREIPDSLLVVGAGYIGLEIGSVYAALGSRVTVVEMAESLLPGVDAELAKPLLEKLRGDGPGSLDELIFEATVKSAEPYEHGLSVTIQDKRGRETTRKFNKALVAVGRQANSGDLGLEKAGVEIDEKGFVRVDEQRRSSQERIFAVGDVAGPPELAHKASHEGRIAAEAAAGKPSAFETAAIPAVVFTDPEIAWTGLTEAEADARAVAVEVARFPWSASGRAVATGHSDGLTKLIFETRSERLLGAGIVGHNAGELIAEATLAVEMGAVATDLAECVHAHPTFSETLMECAQFYLGQSPHYKG